MVQREASITFKKWLPVIMAWLQKNSAVKHRTTAAMALLSIDKALKLVVSCYLIYLAHHINPRASCMIHVTSPIVARPLPIKTLFNGVSQKHIL